jgi:putative membrane protein
VRNHLSPAGLALAALLLVPQGLKAQGINDANIVAIFDGANTADIETGSLAARQGSDERVRQLGQTFVDAHTSARQQGRDLAKKLNVTPVLPANDKSQADHQAAMTRLQGLKGAEFDNAWLDHEIAFHQAVIDAVSKTLLPATRNAELKALEEKVAPAFVGHLQMAKDLRAKIGGQVSGH